MDIQRRKRPEAKQRALWADYCYAQARTLKETGRLEEALNCFCESFLLRNAQGNEGQDWTTFFFVQFAMYLLGKRKLEVLLPEGDMIYALIRDKWIQVKKEIACSDLGFVRNLFEWSKTVQIDFPFELEIFESN